MGNTSNEQSIQSLVEVEFTIISEIMTFTKSVIIGGAPAVKKITFLCFLVLVLAASFGFLSVVHFQPSLSVRLEKMLMLSGRFRPNALTKRVVIMAEIVTRVASNMDSGCNYS